MNLKVKKNILNDIEKIKKERKLSKEVEKNIFNRVITNGAIGSLMLILTMCFMIIVNFLSKSTAILIYNICSIISLILTLIIIENAYKKDSGKLAIFAIEILILSIFILFSPYIYIRVNYKLIHGFILLISVYYVLKVIMIYCKEKKEYLIEISDITNIVKKESKDELAKLEQEKREKQKKILLEKEKQEKNGKTTRKPKTTNKEKEVKSKTSSKKQSQKATKTTTRKQHNVSDTEKTTVKKKTNTTTKKSTTSKKTGDAIKKSVSTKKNTTKKSASPKTVKEKNIENATEIKTENEGE